MLIDLNIRKWIINDNRLKFQQYYIKQNKKKKKRREEKTFNLT